MIDNRKKHKLLITIITVPLRKWHCYFSRRLIQDQPFRYGLKIKNIDTDPFLGGRITGIVFNSAEGKTLYHSCESEFHVSSLNPNKEEIIWIEECGIPLSGIVWLDFVVRSDNGNSISTYQLDEVTRKISAYSKENEWGNCLYFVSRFDYQQERTNNILIFLTLITLIQGIWGLKNFLDFIIRHILEALVFISTKLIFLLSKLI